MRVTKRKALPIALTIAGSDSGGGAGVQADLKTFAAFDVHGTTAITCLTAQNPATVLAIQPTRPEVLLAQLEAIFTELPPSALKTGMLYSAKLIETASAFLNDQAATPPLVVDPVMVATSGARLLKPDAIRALRRDLLPLATLVTPNLDEASLLLERHVHSVAEARDAAREIFEKWGCAALVKGGHRASDAEAVDVLFTGRRTTIHRSPYIPTANTHGTGCSLAAAIAAGLARGNSVGKAVRAAKEFITRAIRERYQAGKHEHLRHL